MIRESMYNLTQDEKEIVQGFEALKRKVDVYATISDLKDLESRLVDYAPVYKVIKIEE